MQRSRVRFPALPDFLSSSGSGTGSTQSREPREVNWGATWMKKSSGSRSRKQRWTAVGTRCADHVTPLYPQKLALTSPTGGGRSVRIVRVRTKVTELYIYIHIYIHRNVLDFGRVFPMLKYTDTTQNTYVRSLAYSSCCSRDCDILWQIKATGHYGILENIWVS